jgi:hypothetical protein
MIIIPILLIITSVSVIVYKEPKPNQPTTKEIVEKERVIREFR